MLCFIQQKNIPGINMYLLQYVTLWFSLIAQAQEFNQRVAILEVNPVWGFVAPHHDYMGYFLEENLLGFQLNAGFQADGTQCWHHYYNFPVTGVGMYHSSLGNDEIYGTLTGAYFYLTRNFTSSARPIIWANTIAFGIAYASKWHDASRNPLNQVLATPMNVFLQYQVKAFLKLNTLTSLVCSAGIAHSSNGNFKEPNKGFNIVTATLGVQYHTQWKRKIANSEQRFACNSLSTGFSIGVFTGTKAISRFINERYPVIGISAEQLFRAGHVHWLGAECSVYRDGSVFGLLPTDTLAVTRETDSWFMVFSASWLMQAGRLAFVFQPGLYLKNSIEGAGNVSNKVGLRYNLSDRWFVGVSIKAHWFAIADFVELSLRYKLKK